MLKKQKLQVILLALLLGDCGELERGDPSPLLDCLPSIAAKGYRCVVDPAEHEIFDGDPRGRLLGPLELPDSGRILDEVVLALDLSHESCADLRGELHYDIDRNGYPDARAAIEMFQSRPSSPAAERLMACELELDGLYFFADEVGNPARTGVEGDSANRPPQAGNGSDRPFAVFRGLRTGGSFYLSVADTLPTKRGSIRSWAICEKARDAGD